MAEVRPFRGIRYNQDVVGDIASVICPPYDVISPEMQHALYHKSPYNLVRVEYALSQLQDNLFENKYTRAAATFREWLERGVLRREGAPVIYLHHHYFTYQGEVRTRRSLMAAVRLEEWASGVVRPHEGTATVFKMDRLDLMRACQANISPVFSLYHDTGNVAPLLSVVEHTQPLFRVATAEDESHTLWAMPDHHSHEVVAAALSGQTLYVADGHHRYETALTYQRERQAAEPAAGPMAAFNFIMMALVEFSDPGLAVLPFHRMVKGVKEPAMRGLKEKLSAFFDTDAVPLSCPLSANMLHRILKPLEGEQVVLGLLGLEPDSLLILRLRDFAAVDRLMPAGRSAAYRKLDVSVLHHVVLERLLGVGEGEDIAYTRSELEAWQRVAAGEYQLAFLLNPADALAVKAIADASDKMPQKSTHFFPKLPSGLVINALDGQL